MRSFAALGKQQPRVYSVFLKPLAVETHRENCTKRGSFGSRAARLNGAYVGFSKPTRRNKNGDANDKSRPTEGAFNKNYLIWR
jgi:hypothetical protein